MEAKYCPISLIQPLLEPLLHHHYQAMALCGQIEAGATREYVDDMHLMLRAMTRYSSSSELTHDFNKDSELIQHVLAKYCCNTYSREVGGIWLPGEPLHFSHFIKGMIKLVER